MNTIDKVRNLRISDYNYPLPDERIAKHPLAEREQCKLLQYSLGGEIREGHFYDVPALLPEKAMLVYNNTRVINARLRFRKATGSTIEIFCLEPVVPGDYQLIFQTTQSCTWLCLVGNSKRWKQGTLTQEITVDGKAITVEALRGERRGNSFEITFSWNGGVTFASILEAIGEIPIPPYLNRGTEASDSADYQTVYSHIDGSVAAPTAGLHFTDAVLAECDARGITRRELTLHVGAGTFQPVKSESIGEHEMHHEFISVERSLLIDLINAPGPVVAVGTTSVRTLESLYYVGQVLEENPDADEDALTVKQWMPYSTPCEISTKRALQNIVDYLDRHHAQAYMGSTQLMIAPGFQYRIISGMITNFHQPQSTLLLLVSAFVGESQWRTLYDYALAHNFRFLSYGDACLFLK
ncbi:MAG: S-adenosylmethionine:tRNA ribosyltransferase-isomerase [Bacteroidales bacterium]|nr:S-adenosylmethionine:tRNA ribosyltransferase-isomerase [Bacteroidales bacterium]